MVNEVEILIEEVRYNNDSIRDLKKEYPNKILKLGEALLKCIGENDFKILKTENPDTKWKYLKEKTFLHTKFSIVWMIIKNPLTI